MQDTLLRVSVLALSLFLCPRDNPGLEEQDDIIIGGVQKHEGSLRGEEADNADHEWTLVSEEVTYPHVKLAVNDKNIDTKEQNTKPYATEGDKVPISDALSVNKEEKEPFRTNLDPGGPQASKTGPEDAQRTTQTEREQMTEGIPRDGGRDKPEERAEENEAVNSNEQGSLWSYLHTWTSDRELVEGVTADWEEDYLWYIWNAFSIISMIRLFRKYLCQGSQINQDKSRPFPVTCTAAGVPLPNSDTLQLFHSTCIQVLSEKKCWEGVFLEGFVNDLLDAMRTVCDKNGSVAIEGFQMVDACDIIVPFRPADFYRFQCLLQNRQAGERPDIQFCGQIKLVEDEVLNGCPCQSSGADDTVCLLHCETAKARPKTDVSGELCTKSSPFLSRHKVTRLFQSTIKQAWGLISHKYEFELSVRYMDAPGSLVVRFRSGKKISFTMNPVVKFNADAYFFIGPCAPNNQDTLWTLSLAKYEDHFLREMSKRLPEDSCHTQTLQIVLFLHRKQTALSGCTALKDSHFKTALMHLLLAKDPSGWRANFIACRLRDMLDFVEKSLDKKLLPHALIGNPSARKVLRLPAELAQANTLNLFHPLVVHSCIYRSAVMHFQELLKNANMLINDYVAQCRGSTSFMNKRHSLNNQN